MLECTKHVLTAAAQELGSSFTVLAGSQARLAWSGQAPSYQQLREDLRSTGILKLSDDGTHLVFTADTPFKTILEGHLTRPAQQADCRLPTAPSSVIFVIRE